MSRPKVVAHIGWVASCHLRRRVDALEERGVRNVVFTDDIPDHFCPQDHHFLVEMLPRELFSRPLVLLSWLEDRLKHHDAEVLHAHSTHLPAALGFFVRAVPVISSIWDFVNARDPFSLLHYRAVLGELERGRLVEGVSFSSKSLMDDWIAGGLPEDHGFWHSWGVNRDTFSPGKHIRKAKALRRSLGIESHEFLFVSPRTPSLPANNDLVVQAVVELKKTRNVRLVITGHHIPREFRYIERLMRPPDVRECVSIVDTVRGDADIAALYEAADAVLSLHSNDFNPATVLEAFAMERPVVVNDLRTVTWWVRNGDTGLVAPVRDVAGTVEVLDHLMSMSAEERKAMARRGRGRVEAEGNFHATMDRLPDDYGTVVSMFKPDGIGLTPYETGLLFDICGCRERALENYRLAAAAGEGRTLLKELAEEKEALLSGDGGLEYFCSRRCQEPVRNMCLAPEEEWPRLIAALPQVPMSLFRHDFCAGFLPLVRARDSRKLMRVIEALATRYHTDTLEWFGEAMALFGWRFGLWEECASLLLDSGEASPALGVFCLEAAKVLGRKHLAYAELLECAMAWTQDDLSHLNAGLNIEFCREVRTSVRELLAE